LKPGLDGTLRQLGVRGDIIKTMHQAMNRDGSDGVFGLVPAPGLVRCCASG
jgi:hypothetical protein